MVKSPIDPVPIPEVAVHQLVLHGLQAFADRVGVVNGLTGKEYTFREIHQRIRSVASGLKKLGVQQRDIIAFLSPNSPDFIFMYIATLVCGATVLTINPEYKEYEVQGHLQDSKARFLFANSENVDKAMKAGKQAGLSQTIIVSGQYPGCTSTDELISDDGSAYPDNVVVNPKEDVVAIPYSSGTTGLPKGIMLTHYNMVSALVQASHPEFRGMKSKDPNVQKVLIAFLPYCHMFGMCLMIGNLMGGGKQITLPRFEPEMFLQLIEKYKVTDLQLVPYVVVFFTKSPLVNKYDLSSVETSTCAAAPLSRDTEAEFVKIMKVPEMKQGYGMTEVIAAACPLANVPLRPGSCGVPLPNTEIQVVDPSTRDVLGPHQRGELWVRGPTIMKGYLNRPEATKETLDEEGWLHTGDLGYYDEESNLYLVDRIKELIKYQGFQVPPAEVEALLINHPGIDDVAVIGVPDIDDGELPRAYVVRKPGMDISEEDVKKYVEDRMSRHKHLRGGVEFTEAIPKSQSGKILRRQLRDLVITSPK